MQTRIQQLEEENRILKSQIHHTTMLEEQLRQAQKMEALANLAGGIAHDFNNILQTILGYIQMVIIQKNENDPSYEHYLQIEGIIKRGSELTKQLLTFGRKIESKPTPLDLNSKIGEIKSILTRTIPKMIDIELRTAEDLVMINADAGQIEQVLMNLSINARDAMADGGKLVFSTENVYLDNHDLSGQLHARSGKYTILSVSDTGCGMSRETVQHIFEPFFTTKEAGKGSGLGLSMVYAIVKHHGGFIECSSKPGEGTVFRVYFPALNGVADRSQAAPLQKERQATRGAETVLLVDDEEEILQILREILDNYGYTVVTARTGEEAIHSYTRSAIDVVVLDVGMPGMGGIKCVEELLSLDERARIIISTGYSLNGKVKKALALGAKDVLAKPYSVEELITVLRKVVSL